MVRFTCRSELDLIKEIWPTSADALPRVGDEVQSAKIWDDSFQLSLQVVKVRWEFKKEWLAIVELRMTDWQKQLSCSLGNEYKGSVRAFYEWYAPKVGKSVRYFIEGNFSR